MKRHFQNTLLDNELLDIAEYLGQDNPEVGQRFIAACEETFAELARMPRLGSPREFDHPDLQDVRIWHVKGFEVYLIGSDKNVRLPPFLPHRGS